ncbi:RagB/SusD family nutrient uptake outer membrane protein [Pedobacter jejuensis]|uniref:RagB/SusD family nutrient uptake outer membrane protein n=1 Tax=Pedobacter jejuensis TaxID=1268550 RepID=A0A3N0BQR8_9SPHI|nr:RagB/SusD family nutrient uptake outer membrane protein [Pedobacter jejuensis]RNL51306.1 RagB/SusD family nutrient uptake outer membrane protein [Pedobacter jejuensis]
MKTIRIKLYTGVLALFISAGACKKEVKPSTAIDDQSALTNPGDIETATIGTYAVLRNATYVRSAHFLTEYQGDNIAQGQPSSDDLSRCYRYTHIPTGTHGANFWKQAYYVIVAANKIIAAIPDNASSELRQLKGENLYLKAMMEFNLVRVFGRPYTQGGGANPGVPVLKEGTNETTPARKTVKEVYDAAIADLLKAADLLTVAKQNVFASKEVAYALLSRIYLNMGDNDNAIKYADLVIASGRYKLLQGADYQSYFTKTPEANSETIFAIRYTKTEDQDFGAIGSMYYSGTPGSLATPGPQGSTGYGEIYASQQYITELDKNPADLRHSFVAPYKINGVLQYNTKIAPNVPMYYVTKYNLQEGIANLSSPVYLRFAEMYLNKAEANAKLGNAQLALNDVNIIRSRAGVPALTLSGIATAGKTALDVVLEERRLEFAFEGQRAYDLFRNNRPMTRNYPGTHALNNTPSTNITQTILPTDARIIFYIPQYEIDNNKNLAQNP